MSCTTRGKKREGKRNLFSLLKEKGEKKKGKKENGRTSTF